APKIERCPNEVTFPEHDNGKIKIFYSGTGPFDVQLYKDGLEVKEDKHLKFTVFDDYVIIYLREALKTDEGKYKIIVKNDSGQADATFVLKVTGKKMKKISGDPAGNGSNLIDGASCEQVRPNLVRMIIRAGNCTGLPGPPQGPLEVSDITQNTATIAWRPPLFDGGSKITNYVVERKETSHSQWIVASSYCRELVFTVQGLTEGGEYLFRVMAVNENGQSQPLEGTNPIIAKLPYGN
ncbi:Twitchin, partial [Araneus ventricosus]